MIGWNDTTTDVAARQAVLFDFDGTLADTKPTIVRVATEVLSNFGIDQTVIEQRVDGIIGPPFPDAFSLVFGLSVAEAAEVTRRYREIYFELGADAWPLFDGIPELVSRLRAAGRLVAAASSKRQEMTERGLADNGILACFDAVCGKVDGVCDTKADAVAAALERLGVGAKDAVMVGDRRFDVEGAAAHDVPCVGVLYGGTGSRAELVDAGAVAIVDTVAELGEVLMGGCSKTVAA